MLRANINTSVAGPLPPRTAAFLFSLTAAGLACGLAYLVPGRPAMFLGLAGFPLVFVSTLALPSLRCLPLGPRTVLVLLALRPLLDLGNPEDASGLNASLKTAYAGILVVVLLGVWLSESCRTWLVEGPNKYLLLLVGLTIVAWAIGGLRMGANGFFRTIWGLIVALLLGPLFHTREQIDTFIRTIFYSSLLLLFVLGFNVQQGEYLEEVWRLGGQFGVPNALAAVTFVFFAYGLYVLGLSQSVRGKLLSLSLLALLAVTIVLTQSRTVGGLMLISICVWLWVHKYRRLLYGLGVPLLMFAVGSNLVFGWRLFSGLSLQTGNLGTDLVDLTGRVYLWAETWQNYVTSDLLHKIIGVGWGTLHENFMSSKMTEVSSVTESSFLWFLAGSGALGLFAFCAYLAWVLRRSWNDSRLTLTDFERRLALLAFFSALAFVIEGATTDLVLSPIASGSLYAILSIFVFCRTRGAALIRGASQ